MPNSSPHDTDELREEILQTFVDDNSFRTEESMLYDRFVMTDKIMELILSREQAIKRQTETKARISQTRRIWRHEKLVYGDTRNQSFYKQEIKGLQAQLNQEDWGHHIDRGPGVTHFKGDECENSKERKI